ncbi:MAG: hypothetical protein CVU09_09490 [Bacteroidetes bacterium HGW-Bacteroidetes-4]|jgi:hypothetical protein|nr:MAG: hypothetical protein CVU09_09490 [Bacteroidetes bacterium HGW-Bacteroidetes-4]
MKKRIRAFFVALIVKPILLDKRNSTLKGVDATEYTWKVKLRWYSPFVWLLFVLNVVRGILAGAWYGFVGVWRSTFNSRPGRWSIKLEKTERFKWYMYY